MYDRAANQAATGEFEEKRCRQAQVTVPYWFWEAPDLSADT